MVEEIFGPVLTVYVYKDGDLVEEIFGPVLTVYVYKDGDLDKALELVGDSTAFALTGAVFAQDKKFLERAADELKMTAGNFYINDKSTGSVVVGQQPFGGARLSGTNDKAGGPHYVLRWGNPQAFLERAADELKMTAGNFYINDKSTGSVVGQQPFGGARLSGTNDKAGGPHYVLRVGQQPWGGQGDVRATQGHLLPLHVTIIRFESVRFILVGQQPFGGARLSGTNDKAGGPHYVLRWGNPQASASNRSAVLDYPVPTIRPAGRITC
ncbi:Aldehyde dehydrogenase family [Popillia japonica]|uniref:Aldehyde dehydrogenase family n=1 Tax=Popillia japonica TaxID=7064 RepID=A0AAW1N9J1_POPJA